MQNNRVDYLISSAKPIYDTITNESTLHKLSVGSWRIEVVALIREIILELVWQHKYLTRDVGLPTECMQTYS